MTIRQSSVLLSRIALFVIYVWFGFLKVIDQSPASEMVENLLSITMPFIPFDLFLIGFGVFEVIIGFLFLIPGKEKIAIILFGAHMIATALPLFITSEVWTKLLVPTLEGQYIVKNLALIACALSVWSATESPKRAASLSI